MENFDPSTGSYIVGRGMQFTERIPCPGCGRHGINAHNRGVCKKCWRAGKAYLIGYYKELFGYESKRTKSEREAMERKHDADTSPCERCGVIGVKLGTKMCLSCHDVVKYEKRDEELREKAEKARKERGELEARMRALKVERVEKSGGKVVEIEGVKCHKSSSNYVSINTETCPSCGEGGRHLWKMGDQLTCRKCYDARRATTPCAACKAIEPLTKDGICYVCNDRLRRHSAYLTLEKLLEISKATSCDICETEISFRGDTPDTARACIDHCHDRNVFRGVLCPGCNQAEGVIRAAQKSGILDKLIAYSNQKKSG